MNHRFKIVNGSNSNHCCFEFTIVDAEEEDKLLRDICECFELSAAQLICDSLNGVKND